ncbi:MAG: hypothetical protein UR28_C0002G0021 [Candidatus Peregrinibacteria bacterium GW2011_GWF2_33_10]|nr:MAG: hypothetical protein UR28_C0002G0021 [Candidatus Peregrinibacteria bacterium GW2011_GWF2_33_10]OGJ45602.1 MAG: hypothetical protein A2263_00675 [Candidatus Peregrinibacteria bacterium RIFOXYA2_FULL_33_21]OGJ46541.1 MAG: hypothetical protein A2272_03690 [Candidatus Peregrinibacteria bacterium RIFOXYA12_FULL_33_12]OGJ51069.1 MAG: hypothetical protein A2307_06335 [Candidatus Peregrinibacteria bacterium RIFOXYB2_FULL_33_20]
METADFQKVVLRNLEDINNKLIKLERAQGKLEEEQKQVRLTERQADLEQWSGRLSEQQSKIENKQDYLEHLVVDLKQLMEVRLSDLKIGVDKKFDQLSLLYNNLRKV